MTTRADTKTPASTPSVPTIGTAEPATVRCTTASALRIGVGPLRPIGPHRWGLASALPMTSAGQQAVEAGKNLTSLDVGVDMDGVLYNFVAALRDWVHQRTGRPLASLPEATCWEFYATDWGLTLAEFLGHCADAVNAGVLFAVGEPYPGAVAAMGRLIAAGHRVHLVTDRATTGAPGMAERATRSWLTRYVVPHTSLTFEADKTAMPRSRTAASPFLEDRPKNYDALDAHPGFVPFLWTRRYNQDHPGRHVTSWESFLAQVDTVAAAWGS